MHAKRIDRCVDVSRRNIETVNDHSSRKGRGEGRVFDVIYVEYINKLKFSIFFYQTYVYLRLFIVFMCVVLGMV